MKILDASCNHCGAALKVDEATRFVTCPSCKSRLSVRVSESTVLTGVLENTAPQAAGGDSIPAADKAPLAGKLQESVQNFVKNPGTGRPRNPSALAGVISIVLGIIAGGGIMALVENGAPRFFLLFALLFFCAGVYNGYKAIGLAWKHRG